MSNMPTFTKQIPIVGGNKKEKEMERMKQILSSPENYNKVAALAEVLNENFDSTVKLMFDIRVGAQIKDTLSNKIYGYEYFVMPFEHDVRTKVIMDMAKKPVDEFPREHIMVVYDIAADPSPRYVISTVDFCKYVACGIWQILDLNVQAEKEFLGDIGKGG